MLLEWVQVCAIRGEKKESVENGRKTSAVICKQTIAVDQPGAAWQGRRITDCNTKIMVENDQIIDARNQPLSWVGNAAM